MIVYAIGAPGRFAEWLEAFCTRLLERSGLSSVPVAAENFRQLGMTVYQRQLSGCLAIARAPDAETCRVLTTGAQPFAVWIAPPETCVADLVEDRRLPFVDGVRAVANSLASIQPLIGAAQGLFVDPASTGRSSDVGHRLSHHFRLNLSSDTVHSIAEDPSLCAMQSRAMLTRTLPSVTHAEASVAEDGELGTISRGVTTTPVLEGATDAFFRKLSGEAMRDVIWGRELFFFPDSSPTAQQHIDVTGPSRCLAYGPYLKLTTGSWACSVILAAAKDSVGVSLLVEVVGGSVLTRAIFEVIEPGVFELALSFVVSAPDHPLEVRLFNAAAAFEGRIALLEVRLSPLQAARIYPQ